MGNIKQISRKNHSYYLLNEVVNVKNFGSNLLNINKISFKITDDNIKYITIKSIDHVNIDGENTLYLIFNYSDGYIEENIGYKYLMFAHTDKNKEILEKDTEL